jgi:hypothetical protein
MTRPMVGTAGRLLEGAVDSEYESSKISARSRRAAAANAALGRPHVASRMGTGGCSTPRPGPVSCPET